MQKNRREWRKAFAQALSPVSNSITAHRRGLPALSNMQYRALANEAEGRTEAHAMLVEYLTEIHSDPIDVIDLFVKHPSVGRVFGGIGSERATYVAMPGKGFRVELKQLARRAATIGARRGDELAAAEIDRFLALSAEGRLPGYHVIVIRGLSMDGTTELGAGAKLASYESAVELGLLKKPEPPPLNDDPDYQGMEALVLFREMTWMPCLVPPKTSKNINDSPPEPRFTSAPELFQSVLLDLLSLVTSQRIDLVEIFSCAPEFIDVDPSFGSGSKIEFRSADWWKPKELTTDSLMEIRRLIIEWTCFNADKRDILELALGRFVSSIRRDQGRFKNEDRILDVSVALEVMFGLRDGELTHKLSTRAAYLLGDTPAERVKLYEGAKRFYGARSRIIHGDWSRKRGKREELTEIGKCGYDLGRDAMLKLLERGAFPNWEKLVLSAE